MSNSYRNLFDNSTPCRTRVSKTPQDSLCRSKFRRAEPDSSDGIESYAQPIARGEHEQNIFVSEGIAKSVSVNNNTKFHHDFSRQALKSTCEDSISKNQVKSNTSKELHATSSKSNCRHYARRCKLRAECCQKFFSCRFCHDEAEDHEMDRFATEVVSCSTCGAEQAVSEHCIQCKTTFARYFCRKCKFYDDDPDKDIFHCDRCGLCRNGKVKECRHCDICNSCISLKEGDEHKCLPGVLHGNCPCCLEYMHTSRIPVVFLRCGHAMHFPCFETYTQKKYTCPLCCRSMSDMRLLFAEFDRLLALQPKSKQFEDVVCALFCNDCLQESNSQYHTLGYYKCSASVDCGSYNTIVRRVYNRHENSK